jgi:hypothetical protein
MADLDPFDLVRRLANVPVVPLVNALRQLHDRGITGLPSVDELLGPEVTASEEKPPAALPKASSPDYEAARRHFVRHSEQVREQAMLAERLLDGLAGPLNSTVPVVLQRELRVQCPLGASSGARFVVVNRLEHSIHVRFRPGRVHGLSEEQSAGIHLSFTPGPPLEPGAEREVQLRVQVDGGQRLPDVLDIGVDVMGDEQMLLKLWVRIELCQGGVGWTNAT